MNEIAPTKFDLSSFDKLEQVLSMSLTMEQIERYSSANIQLLKIGQEELERVDRELSIASNKEIEVALTDNEKPRINLGLSWLIGLGIGVVAYLLLGQFWYGFFAFIGAVIAFFFGTMIVQSVFSSKQESQAKEALRLKKNQQQRERDAQIKNATAQRDELESKLELLRKVQSHCSREHERINNEFVTKANEINDVVCKYDIEFMVDEFDDETKGKPKITWQNSALGGEASIKLSGLAAERVRAEFMISSGTQSIITDDVLSNTHTVHKDLLMEKGEFIDRSVRAGDTVIYYVLVLIKFPAIRPNEDGSYRIVEREVEAVLETRRITAAEYKPLEQQVDEEISKNTAEIKRIKARQKFEKTMADLTGDGSDLEAGIDAALKEATSLAQRQKLIQQGVERIEVEGKAAGLTGEQIEEAVESFLQKSS